MTGSNLPRGQEWTPEQDKILRAYLAKGLSASQVARHIEGKSRAAVIGRAPRLKIPLMSRFRQAADRRAAARPKPSNQAKPSRPTPASLPAAAADTPDTEGLVDDIPVISRENAFLPLPGTTPVRLSDLTESTCKWPVDGVHGRDGLFCGQAKTLDVKVPYCAVHSRIAFNPAPLKRL